MDPDTESEAIRILATQGYKKYRDFLKSKTEPDFLSREEIAFITKPNFDYTTVCDQIRRRATEDEPIVEMKVRIE